jgi:hypothetical protein
MIITTKRITLEFKEDYYHDIMQSNNKKKNKINIRKKMKLHFNE